MKLWLENISDNPFSRNEDPRLLTGKAQFIDDIKMPGMLHAAFLRSDYAHARIKSIDVSAAGNTPVWWQSIPLPISVITGNRARCRCPRPAPSRVQLFNARTLIPIAKDKVRFSGEPLAVVIAETRYIAEDAFEDIVVDMEPLPVVTDLEKALEHGSPLVHDDLPINLAADVNQERGNYAEAAKKADVVIKRKILVDRGAGGAMENRGFVVDWDDRTHRHDHLGYHPGAHPAAQQHCRPLGSVRKPGAGDHPLHRWWFWTQNHDLPGR